MSFLLRQPRWKRKIGSGSTATLIVDDGRLIANRHDRDAAHLICLNAETGSDHWVVPITNPPVGLGFRPLLRNGDLYYADRERIIRVAARTGQIRNSFKLTGGDYTLTTFGSWKDLLLVPTVASILYAFSIESLEVAWRFSIRHGPPYAEPVAAGDRIYLSAAGATTIAGHNEVICLDARNGEVVWRTEGGRSGQFFCHPPAVWRDRLIVREDRYSRNLLALDIGDGSPLWHLHLGLENERSQVFHDLNCKPLLVGDVLYINSPDGCLYAVAPADGKVLWRCCTEGALEASPVLSHGLLFVGSNDGHVYAIHPAKGHLVSEYWAGGQIWTSPVVHDNLLLFYTSMEMQAWLHAVQIVP